MQHEPTRVSKAYLDELTEASRRHTELARQAQSQELKPGSVLAQIIEDIEDERLTALRASLGDQAWRLDR